MFDQIEQGDTKRYKSPIPESVEAADKLPASELDSEPMMELHTKLLGFYRRELDRQFENRAEQAIDEDFYDGIQYTEKDAQELESRGQVALVFNVIATTLNWILGAQKRQRIDYKVLPRRKDDGKPAERKTALLKYLSDVNKTPFARSRAFEDAMKVGVGWMECGIEDSDGGDPAYSRYESWRNMLWDSAAVEDDLNDARYIIRSKWVDTDLLKAIMPRREQLIDESVDLNQLYASGIEIDGDEAMDSREIENQDAGMLHERMYGATRPRVRVIEMWFRKPEESYRMIGGAFAGDVYDFSDAHDDEIRSGRARLEKKRTLRIYVALFTTRGFLWIGPSPYRHNRYPFTPVWGYRRGRDGMPYGTIRGVRSLQIDINKRASKSLYILSSNKVVMDEDALPDDVTMQEFADEVSRPDAIIRKRAGREMKLDADRDLAPAHMELMSRSIQLIQQQFGITDELMGRETNAVSGIAITRRQDQGTLATATLFDHLRYALQCHGEKELSLVEQFYSQEKEFRITNMRGTPEYVTLNSGDPEDDITRSKADFIIAEADWHFTLRQAAAEALLQVANKMPEVGAVIIDLLVENLDLPNREEIVKRLRAASGLPDPDAEEPTPEQVAAEKMKALATKMQMDAAVADLQTKQANAKWTLAQAKEAEADAIKAMASARKLLAEAVGQSVETQGKAIEAAIALLAVGDVGAPVADKILHEAGFQGEPERKAMMGQLTDQRMGINGGQPPITGNVGA